MRLALLLALAAQAAAQTVSPAPDSVAVTIYRAPYRPAEQKISLSWLEGFALVSEKRTIAIPAGEGDIRFEGVAAGIVPESAIVTGLPDGVIEKNQDALLLSARTLVERTLGRAVRLKRTSKATGAAIEQDAIVRSGADGALVLQTADGFEALRCSGLYETVTYDRVPEGLSAKPTLSVRTRAARAATATVTLSYLASSFDWQANYVATLAPDGRHLDLHAWVTLASGDDTSFRDAQANAVAGRLNQAQAMRRYRPRPQPLHLRCWPSDTTSDVPAIEQQQEDIIVTARRSEAYAVAPPPPPAPPPAPATAATMAEREDLGDLKLYRIPEPVTVAAHSQKQVVMLAKQWVPVELFYRSRLWSERAEPMRLVARMRNTAKAGLGVPLPAGGFALFTERGGRPLLLGEGSTGDKAVGEKVEIPLGQVGAIAAGLTRRKTANGGIEALVKLTNAERRPVAVELDLQFDSARFVPGAVQEDGRWLLRLTLAPNSSRTIRYKL